MRPVSRFAPSTTGPAHPGTLLAALLCWLDARARDARLLLRLEDLDPERSSPERVAAMRRDLAWLGLDWDAVQLQSGFRSRHEAALDALAASGRLYPCACSRSSVRALGLQAPDGGFRYPNTCRGRALPPGGWRASREPLRAALQDGRISPRSEGGDDLAADPAAEFGDPVVWRREGAVAYHLASVADDGAEGVTRVVRGRDLAPSSASQVALQRLLGLAEPVYRHHLLLLEEGPDRKLSKLHGAIGADALRARTTPEALCGWLAHAAGLRASAVPTTPRELLADFSWDRVHAADRVVRVRDGALVLAEAALEAGRREAAP